MYVVELRPSPGGKNQLVWKWGREGRGKKEKKNEGNYYSWRYQNIKHD